MKRQMEEELKKKEEELANLSRTYEERMKEAAKTIKVCIVSSPEPSRLIGEPIV